MPFLFPPLLSFTFLGRASLATTRGGDGVGRVPGVFSFSFFLFPFLISSAVGFGGSEREDRGRGRVFFFFFFVFFAFNFLCHECLARAKENKNRYEKGEEVALFLFRMLWK